MVSEAPPFWWLKSDWRAWALYPASWVYGSIARSLMERAPRTPVDAPVICVGNFTVGGAGKTPTALALADAARKAGMKPGFLSRGYRGNVRATTRVEVSSHDAREVGDEPLLLAAKALTVVSADRVEGARRLLLEGADIIIMDDGFQSAALLFDYALLVVDAHRGIGNGHVIPGGPMRAPLLDQMRHASALLVIGEGTAADRAIRSAARAAKPVFSGALAVLKPRTFKDKRLLAFAAIGNPEKFFDSLRSTGAHLVSERSFGDHHHFSDEEIREILETAAANQLDIVTTSKDMVRLRAGRGLAVELADKSRVLDVRLEFEQPDTAATIISSAIGSFKKRKLQTG